MILQEGFSACRRPAQNYLFKKSESPAAGVTEGDH